MHSVTGTGLAEDLARAEEAGRLDTARSTRRRPAVRASRFPEGDAVAEARARAVSEMFASFDLEPECFEGEAEPRAFAPLTRRAR